MKKAWLILGVTALLLSACGRTPVTSAPQEPEAGLATSGLSPYTDYTWKKGEGTSLPLLPGDVGFCWLSGVEGGFWSSSDQVRVYKDFYGLWKMDVKRDGRVGYPGPQSAHATCLNWSALKNANSAIQPVQWLSDEFIQSVGTGGSVARDTWWGDAVTFLTGVGGDLSDKYHNYAKDGCGGVQVQQMTSGYQPSKLRATSCPESTSPVTARAYSMFFGKPHSGDNPQFWGPNGQGVQFSSVGEYEATEIMDDSSEWLTLAPSGKAFCYLTKIGGDFEVNDEVRLHRVYYSASKQEYWQLEVHQGPHQDEMSARAACYMLTQY